MRRTLQRGHICYLMLYTFFIRTRNIFSQDYYWPNTDAFTVRSTGEPMGSEKPAAVDGR